LTQHSNSALIVTNLATLTLQSGTTDQLAKPLLGLFVTAAAAAIRASRY